MMRDRGPAAAKPLQAMRANRLRSFLTLLGIIIGVATLVGVVSVISGLNGWVQEKVIQLSPGRLRGPKFGIIRSREEFLDAVKRPDIAYDDYYRVAGAAAEGDGRRGPGRARRRRQVRATARLPDIRVQGTTANYGDLMNMDLVRGPLLRGRRGRERAAGGGDRLGRQGRAVPAAGPASAARSSSGGAPYRVIGLLAKQGRTLGQSRDATVIIPIQAWRRQWGNRDSVDIVVRARGGVPGVEASIDEVRAVLRALRHTDFRAPDPVRRGHRRRACSSSGGRSPPPPSSCPCSSPPCPWAWAAS